MPKKQYCEGCRDDFYNGKNDAGINQCWHFKSAKIVKLWRINTWVQPIRASAFTEVKTHDCHNEPGYAFYSELPTCAVEPIRLKR